MLCYSSVLFFIPQSKYKDSGRRSLSQSFYSQLPETAHTEFVKTVTELQSEVSHSYIVSNTHVQKLMHS